MRRRVLLSVVGGVAAVSLFGAGVTATLLLAGSSDPAERREAAQAPSPSPATPRSTPASGRTATLPAEQLEDQVDAAVAKALETAKAKAAADEAARIATEAAEEAALQASAYSSTVMDVRGQGSLIGEEFQTLSRMEFFYEADCPEGEAIDFLYEGAGPLFSVAGGQLTPGAGYSGHQESYIVPKHAPGRILVENTAGNCQWRMQVVAHFDPNAEPR